MTASKTPVRRTPALGLTPKRRALLLDELESHGLFTRAAKALRVDTKTIWRWRRQHADLEGDIARVRDRQADRIGIKYVRAVERHVDAVLEGARLPDRYAVVQKTGERVLIEEGRPIQLNTELCRMALTRLDGRWVQTAKDEMKDAFSEIVAEVLREREKRVVSDS